MNLPNALSLFRLTLVPAFIAAFLSSHPYAYPIATAIFIFAGLTDMLDGYIARKYNQITMLGRFLDPLADKLMVFSALVCLTVRELMPLWLTALFFVKEAVQGIGGLVLFRKIRDVPPSNIVGKAATVTFYAAIAFITLIPGLSSIARGFLLGLSFMLMLLAFTTYLLRALRLSYEQRNATTRASDNKENEI